MFAAWQKWIGFTMACAVLCGCGGGPKLAPVKGKVTYKDQPVANASITFMPAEQGGQVASGTTDAQGQYTLNTLGKAGVVPAKYLVGIVKASSQGDNRNYTPDDMKRMIDQKNLPQAKSEIPQKYAGPQTSNLQATVTADGAKNTFDFALTD